MAGRKRKQGMITPNVRSYGGLSAVSSTSGEQGNHQQSPPPATAAANLHDFSCLLCLEQRHETQPWPEMAEIPLGAPSKEQPVNGEKHKEKESII